MFGIIAFISSSFSTTFYSKNTLSFQKKTLSGKITDKKTGEPLPGVSIYITDLKTGTTSGTDGTYKIENLPQSRVLVQVSFIGYKLIIETIDLSVTTTKDFALEESIAELNEIVVTGLSKAAEKNRTPTPISTISPIQLLQNSSTNIIDALANQPGISQVTSGAGISKPAIRGLGYNRVVTVIDGIRQEGQQWGDEHGIEIDEFAVNKVEILKGPASLSYGSDAMAGVINMLSAPTLPDGKIMGNILANYQTNNGLIAYSANFAGNQKGFIWDIRYSNKMAHSYQNKYDGYVFNSGYKENTFGGIIGFNKSWGYSHLHFSVYNLNPGIVEGKRDSVSGKFLKPITLNDSTADATIASESDFKSYTPLTPYQKIHHYKVVLNNSFIIRNGSLKATIGWQQNQRQEYADILNVNRYALFFLLNTINYDLRYILPEKNNLSISFGANGMGQTSQNKGVEFLIPEYNLFDLGVFFTAKKTIEKLDISGGLRYDRRNEKGKDLFLNAAGEKVDSPDTSSFHQFNAFNSTFSGVSGSIGATYQLTENVFTKINISRGFRAPNIAEISANGTHEGSLNYIIGVPTLKAESSLQFDYALGLNSNYITAEIDLFSNYISNYIFLSKLNSASGGDSLTDGFSTFNYSSGNANLSGGEVSIDIHTRKLEWLHFENSFSYVQAVQKNQPDSTKYLPFTPAPKYTSELKISKKKLGKYFSNSYFKFGIDYYFSQNKFYAAFGTETETKGYTLLNCGMGTDILSKNKILFSIYINANNITDIGYQSHLSRLKYGDVNNVSGRTGVFNMGRNISFKLIVPLDFRRKKTD
ncbi:MAG: TonB-dependent receptor [Bacteroidetes bacterium RIFCSPLOWO2_12_FULL_35_15]|nr:MAG: TonB-dependent receptor [Bacteroidetes bacterium RIFCSPLOWO2_12_FULL_35_15]